MELHTVSLAKHHIRKEFDCGQVVLDEYLKKQANQDIRKRIAMCFIISDEPEDNRVKGYYTLSNTSIPRDLIPDDLQRRFPHAYKSIPATLLGRLARDRNFTKQGIGEKLLIDALYRSYLASREIGSFAVVVEPINEIAEQFYSSYGFTKLPDSGKMILAMKTIEQLFE